MTAPATTSPAAALVTVFGGERFPAQGNDGHPREVFVRTLPLRLVPKYLELLVAGDDQGIIELCLGLDARGADAFTPACQEALLAKCDELNFFTAQRWIDRNKDRREKIAPLLQALYSDQAKLMGPSLEQMATLLISSLTPVLRSGNPPTPSSTSADLSSSSSSNGTPAASASTASG